MIRRWVAGIGLALALLTCASAADYPDHPIRLIVPTSPGGVNDIVARLIQPGLTEALKQPIVIENKPGANNMTGTNFVAKSPPDGYTLVVVPASHSVNPAVQAKMPFDTEKDLTPIILIGKTPMLFLTNPQVPAKSLRELAVLAKASPNKLSFSTPGLASQANLVIAQWRSIAGIQATDIPYRGGAPAMLATISGETQFTVVSSVLAAPQVQAGKLRPLAIGSLKRDPHFPDVPTFDEAGFPGLEAITWVGIFAPAGTPPAIVARLNGVIDRIIHQPDITEKLDAQGIAVDGGPPDALGRLVADEIKRWTTVATQNRIKVDR
ncbi:tripartite tricarboxylate transporter substrate binding protein [Microbacteriaceae bacterium K1510]|nr:tripartite tricarboxylate transporter substrate binding protein [Microbacteriaceae bacterium K1510]